MWKERIISSRKLVLIDKAGVVRYRDEAYKVGDEAAWSALLAAVHAL